jgi:hypothetical protein
MTAQELPLDPQQWVADLRDQSYRALRAAMPAAILMEASRCAARLHTALPHQETLRHNRILVAYGGGKDSSYMLAFVRAMQLILYRIHGDTFQLRVATNRHAGMPRAVMENMDRVYQALRLFGDPECELLLIDGDEVSPFEVDAPQREHVIARNRLDILMAGHRTFGDGRPTFCNACNLSMFNSFGLAASYGAGADLIVTGDSTNEQRQYSAWVNRLARRIAPSRQNVRGKGFARLLSQADGIAQAYFTDIHGADATEALAQRKITSDVPESLRFFSIYSDTAYRSGDHMELLTEFLGFQFDDLAFSFTESDCGNPALMAHLRALRCEHVYRRPYAEGLAEYVEFALDLMRQKDYPADLIAVMRTRYEGPQAADRMRAAMTRYASDTFGLTETQLVCLVYSPFAEQAAGLADFLTREHPALADRVEAIHALLREDDREDPALADELTRISGLNLRQLRVLHGRSLRRPGRDKHTEPIDAVLAGDPHKAVIPTQHEPNGPVIFEQISGR